MGLGMRHQPVSQLARDLSPWTLGGFAAVLMSGPLIFSSDPNLYLNNPSFRFKMGALLIGLLFQYTIHRKVALSDPSQAVGAMVGVISVALWVSVIFSGLFIAFV
jgi:hypothetical protein